LGCNLTEGKDIQLAIENLQGTSIANLIPNREKNKGKINTIPGISNWFEWEWPTEGQYAGYIRARSLPNIGEWKNFSPVQIQKLSKAEITKSQPQISTPTKPNSSWTSLIPKNIGNHSLI